ncbi:MAG: hypothetical protein CL581_17035 [Alteromonadaceae bacterium]|nr:hypothetical protein [Alteromonadaceae bacterium]MBH85321.1 hypothetical protein [Alteromonadaceae bacterium]|tara:strand:+ start:550 stop:792 length:243 start_codon:yes stop_codon:yes gene_type:complete
MRLLQSVASTVVFAAASIPPEPDLMMGRRLIIGLAALMLTGCGQKGPLFKAPEPEAAPVQSEQPAALPENDKPDEQGAAE